MSRPRVLSLPNILSLSRLPLAAAFLLVAATPVRLLLLAAASITDLLDGWLARRGRTTALGALLDPVGDKTFVLAALSAFVANGVLPVLDCAIILSRDLATAVGFIVAHYLPGLDPARFRARWAGKIVTVLQLAALLVLLTRPSLLPALIPAIAVASAWAIADYTRHLARTRTPS